MADFNPAITLAFLKARLGIKVDSLDGYLTQMILVSHDKLVNQMGIPYQETRFDYVMLLVDYAAWRYQNRDAAGEMPKWLRLELRELYLSSHAQEVPDAVV